MRKTKIFILLFVVALGLSSHAQTGINSPYSRYGLGQLYGENLNTVSVSMGGLGIAIHNPTVLNPENPASYGSLDSAAFLFEIGVSGNLTTLKTETLTENGYDATLSYIFAGFPITQWWRSGIGIMPFSKIGYNVEVLIEVPDFSDVSHSFTGDGGLNKVFWGNGFNITKKLRFGVDATYLFGQSTRTSRIYYPDSVYILGTKVVNTYRVGDFIFDYGLQYDFNVNEKITGTVGLIFSNNFNLTTKFSKLATTIAGGIDGQIEYVKDTIVYEPEVKGSVTIPQRYGVGIAFNRGENWLIGADFEWQKWEDYAVFGVKDTLSNSWRIALGGEFTPKHTNISSLFKRLTYRAGFRYNHSYLKFGNNNINEFGISFGFGIPLKNSKTGIDLGMEYGRRGTTDNGLIQENFFNFVLGISVQENWFQKRKYR